MTCADATRLIGPWMDDELDARSIIEVEGHVARCASCGREKEQLLALREAARARLPRFELPARLEARIFARPARRFLRDAALVSAAACVAAVAAVWLAPGEPRGQLIDAHLRSLQAQHLTDVASSDQHTVKPWFQGKLDFSVPVKDFAGRGFPLAGGRLDLVEGRQVAALVYRRRQHLLNLFIWPAARGDAGPRSVTARGYRETGWAQAGFEYRLVSDLAPAESDELIALLRE